MPLIRLPVVPTPGPGEARHAPAKTRPSGRQSSHSERRRPVESLDFVPVDEVHSICSSISIPDLALLGYILGVYWPCRGGSQVISARMYASKPGLEYDLYLYTLHMTSYDSLPLLFDSPHREAMRRAEPCYEPPRVENIPTRIRLP